MDSPVPNGRARGVAVTSGFESFAAHMAEVPVGKKGKITVYPADAIRSKAESGVSKGLSKAFHEKVGFSDGAVKTTNYDDYPVLNLSEVPEIEVHIANNNLKAGGIGEPVFPSVTPAVANAIFKATGLRLRELPFKRELLAKS